MPYADDVMPFDHHLGLNRNQMLDAVLENRSDTPSSHALGLIYFDTNSSAKLIRYCIDASAGTYAHIPRFDAAAEDETISNLVTFDRAGAPFAVSDDTQVDNLNAEYVNGYDTSVTAVQNKIPVYATGGALPVGAPTDPGHAAPKSYVDSVGTGLYFRDPCQAATTDEVADLSNSPVDQDGYTLVEGERLLVKDGASPDGVEAVSDIHNGLYEVGVVVDGFAPLTRTTDCDTGAKIDSGTYTTIENGLVNKGSSWVQTTNNPTLGTDDIVFRKFFQAYAQNEGNGISISGTTIAVKVAGSTSYTQGAILYHGTTATLSSLQGNGVLKLNGTSAPTVMNGATNRLTFWSDANTLSSDANLTWNGSTLAVTGDQTLSGDLTLTAGGTINTTSNGNIVLSPHGTGDVNLAGILYVDQSAGNVGIGTTSPLSKLSVETSGSTSDIPTVIFKDTANSSYLNLTTGNVAGAAALLLDKVGGQRWAVGLGAWSGGNDIEFYDRTNSAYRMVVTTSGNVGIGTTSPLDLLNLKEASDSAFATQLLLQNEGANNHTAGIGFQVAGSGEYTTYGPKAGICFQRTASNGRGVLKFYNRATNDTAGFDANDEIFRIISTQLSVSSLVQTDSNRGLITSNNLPAATTIDSFALPRFYATTVGDGETLVFTVTHGIGSEDVIVQCWDATGSKRLRSVACKRHESDPTTKVVLTFTTPPEEGGVRVLCTGATVI